MQCYRVDRVKSPLPYPFPPHSSSARAHFHGHHGYYATNAQQQSALAAVRIPTCIRVPSPANSSPSLHATPLPSIKQRRSGDMAEHNFSAALATWKGAQVIAIQEKLTFRDQPVRIAEIARCDGAGAGGQSEGEHGGEKEASRVYSRCVVERTIWVAGHLCQGVPPPSAFRPPRRR